VQSPSQAASNAASPSPSWITATVEHRVLAQTVISRGDVHPEVAIPIGVPTSTEGSPVVTAIGISVGAEVTEGTRVAEVSGRPVFVLQGEVPVYRPLKPLMVGTDVEQLQRALGRLGCDTSADGGVYGEATKACVARFYADAGYTPIPTSPTDEADIAAATQALIDAQTGIDSAQLTLDRAQRGPSDEEILAADTALNAAQRAYNDAVASGDVAVAQALDAVTRAQAALDELRNSPEATPADVLAAENEVAAASGALDSARRGRQSTIADAIDAITLSQSARDALDLPPDATVELVAFGQATAARDRAQTTLDTLRTATGPTVPQGEVVFSPTLPARAQRVIATLGPLDSATSDGPVAIGGSPGNELATLAAGELVVSMTLRADEVALVRVGMEVDLLDEQSNVSYTATITEIGAIARTTGDGQSAFPVTITPAEGLPDQLSGANVRVTVTAASTAGPSLVVPLAAVSSAADGSTNVSTLAPTADLDADPVIVPVEVGLSADGFVAIKSVTPGALNEGDKVVVGR